MKCKATIEYEVQKLKNQNRKLKTERTKLNNQVHKPFMYAASLQQLSSAIKLNNHLIKQLLWVLE